MDPIANRLAVIAPTVEADLAVFLGNLRKLESQLILADIDFIFVYIYKKHLRMFVRITYILMIVDML